jgi:ATP-dependent Clp protease protease subunit
MPRQKRPPAYIHSANVHETNKSFTLIGELDEEKLNEAINGLTFLDAFADGKPLTINLCTNGGPVPYGLALYDFIRTLKSETRIIGLGQIASMGVVILQAADPGLRLLRPHARLTLHRGSMAVPDPVHLTDFDRLAKETKVMGDLADKIVCENMGIRLVDFSKRYEHDTYLDAERAIEVGLADTIYVGD